MRIKVAELQRATNVLLDQLQRSGHEEIELTASYYWNIPTDHLYRAEEAPPAAALDLGDLCEDWEEVQAVGVNNDPLPSHDLVHLAGLLRFIASRVLP